MYVAVEYAKLFRGMGDVELIALADSFAFARCQIRDQLVKILKAAASG